MIDNFSSTHRWNSNKYFHSGSGVLNISQTPKLGHGHETKWPSNAV